VHLPEAEVEEAAALVAQLVAIPSLTLAAGQAPPDVRHGEAAVAAAVAAWLTARGFRPEWEEVEPGRPHVTARVGEGRPELLLTSHLDTVPPAGWTTDPFTPVRDGTRLTGLGACDDKGSLAAMLLALDRLARAPHPLSGTVTFVAMVGEETFGVGSHHYVRSGHRPDAAIVGEPTELRLVRVECGNVRWRVHTLGRPAHGSRPWEGDNAIYRMAAVLRVLEEVVAPECRGRVHPLIGPAAFNVGLVEGGVAVNIVPPRCTLTLERRVLPGEEPRAAMEAINALLRERIGAEHLAFDPPISFNQPLDTPADAPLVRALGRALAAHGRDPEPAGVSYGSDANRLAAVQVPCALFGPGSIRDAHTGSEWVDARDVALAARVLVDTATGYLA
jgi:succinyl-diaminopimelate desuccinylase